MSKEVAYVPVSQVKENQVAAPTKIDTPSYPDRGVAYAGYSKTPLSGNQFILNPQTPWTFTQFITSFVGVQVHTLGYPDKGKTLYIKSLQIGTSISAVDANSHITLFDYPKGGVTPKTLFKMGLLRSEHINFTFDVPLKVEGYYDSSSIPSGLTLYVSSGAATLNTVVINMQGWIE